MKADFIKGKKWSVITNEQPTEHSQSESHRAANKKRLLAANPRLDRNSDIYWRAK